eukprot:TRINITY_DN13640_c0_g1_i1.p1 TRINITY_DN13640_c0_g1~~TRINITY_DN13640_c0_g1_i1.p1  ORF type:complete len:471 (+),score=131.86 TRINITY_DN13640_c0_g1_i1:81-1493(+)
MGVENGTNGANGRLDDAVERFREFVKIPSVCGDGQANGSYRQAADWLTARCKAIGLDEVKEVSPVENKPIVIGKLTGKDPSLPSVLLNSHYDVVPCMTDKWCCDPFAAEIREGYVVAEAATQADAQHRGKGGKCVFGRGTQDMKCVCVQYLEALERLLKTGWKPLRTCYLTFVPDEEIGGTDGMAKLLYTEEFQAMQPIAIALDEGLANPADAFTVFYGERTPWWILVRATGQTGHGSRFIADTAASKLMGVMNKALEFRKEQEASLGWKEAHAGCKHSQAKKLGDVTTLNLTMMRGGVSVDGGKTYSLNVVPTEMEAGFDVRITPGLATSEFKAKLDEWCKEEGLSWQFAPWTSPLHEHCLTSTDRDTNPFYAFFEDACTATGHKVEREIFPAATDSRFLRLLGIRALGFTPLSKTPILLHEHNEALSVEAFMRGIDAYCKVLPALLDAPKQEEEKNLNGSAAKKPRLG